MKGKFIALPDDIEGLRYELGYEHGVYEREEHEFASASFQMGYADALGDKELRDE